MKLALAAVALLFALPAHADDYSAVPPVIRAQIKAKCVGRYPDDYSLQRGCIANQSEAYLDVHGGEATEQSDEPIYSAFLRSRLNNSAYLAAAAKVCGTRVGNMPERYAQAVIAGHPSAEAKIRSTLAAMTKSELARFRSHKRSLCAEVTKNLPNFKADVAQQ